MRPNKAKMVHKLENHDENSTFFGFIMDCASKYYYRTSFADSCVMDIAKSIINQYFMHLYLHFLPFSVSEDLNPSHKQHRNA